MSDNDATVVEDSVAIDFIHGEGACAYIDALGTVEQLSRLADGGMDALIEQATSMYQMQQASLPTTVGRLKLKMPELKHIGYQVISDSTFILSISGDLASVPYAIARSCIAMADAAATQQVAYLVWSRLCRGGIASGYICQRENIILGIPISHAVGLERSVAKQPCIVMSRSAEVYIRNLLFSLEDEMDADSIKIKKEIVAHNVFLYREDGRLIINPYSWFADNLEDKSTQSLIESCYGTIRRGLHKHELDSAIYNKYAFARDLNNFGIHCLFEDKELWIPVPGNEQVFQFWDIFEFVSLNTDRLVPQQLRLAIEPKNEEGVQ